MQPMPFSVPDIRDFVPEKIKPWIYFFFFVIYQFSGGVYLASVSEMVGSLSLLPEDIMMAGYASLLGLALTFTIMFRLKFRFATKTSLIITAVALIACNIICMHIDNVPLLVGVCFIAGFFRMWGTFTCNSNIQLWITPTRDMSVWFCYIEVCIQGFMQLSGLTTVYVTFLAEWKYMYWLIIGLLLCILLITGVAFRHYRSMKKLPLYGIDWMGCLLWAITILSVIFVFNYGDHYDWFQSVYIKIGCVIALSSLALNVWRASFIRHPFIANRTWGFRNVWLTFILFIIIETFVSPGHLFEDIYTEDILGYDSLNFISLNWIVLLGFAVGALFSYRTFALRKWKYKTMTLIGFSLLLIYLFIMYFIIDYNLPKEMLFLPILIRALGYIIVDIAFITSLSVVPFQNFFQTLTIQAFVSACCGALIGNAFLRQVFKFTLKKNAMLLGGTLDKVNPYTYKMPFSEIYGTLQKQAVIVSMKEIYGWFCIAGIFCILLFLLKESTLRPKSIHPKFSTIRSSLKHQLKMDTIDGRD